MEKRNVNRSLFFEATSEHVDLEYKEGTFSVKKSGLSIVLKILGYLNSNNQNKTVIMRINKCSQKIDSSGTYCLIPNG